MNQSEGQANTCNPRQARNDCEHVWIDFSFTFDWLRKWRFFFTNRRAKQGKTKANANYFRQSLENCSILDLILAQ